MGQKALLTVLASLTFAGACGSETDSLLSELESQRQRWNDVGIIAYRFDYGWSNGVDVSSFSCSSYDGIEVRNETVTSTGTSLEGDPCGGPWGGVTITAIFERLERTIDVAAMEPETHHNLRVRYHPEYGFAQSSSYQEIQGGRAGTSVTNFEVLEQARRIDE